MILALCSASFAITSLFRLFAMTNWMIQYYNTSWPVSGDFVVENALGLLWMASNHLVGSWATSTIMGVRSYLLFMLSLPHPYTADQQLEQSPWICLLLGWLCHEDFFYYLSKYLLYPSFTLLHVLNRLCFKSNQFLSKCIFLFCSSHYRCTKYLVFYMINVLDRLCLQVTITKQQIVFFILFSHYR